MSAATPRTQEQRREESISRMIQAAVNLIATRGVAALTMAEVGIQAGYSRGLAHQHFGTKEKLLSECLDDLAEQFNVRRYASHASTKGLKGIYSLVDAYLIRPADTLKYPRALILIILDASVRESSLYEAVSAYNEKTAAYIAAKLREAKALGEIRAEVPEEASAFVLMSLLRGFTVNLLSTPRLDPLALQRAAYELIAAWLMPCAGAPGPVSGPGA